jgi:hypothetical protein
MYKVLISFLFLLMFTSFANAQSGVPKVELFTGYSNLHTESGNNLNGFTASVSGNVSKSVGVVADVSGVYSNGAGEYLLLFGPRYSFRQFNKFTPFVHSLFGAIGPDPAFAMAFGGGLDLKVNNTISIRLIQADYIQLRTGSNSVNTSRVSCGIVFNLGKK